MEKTCLPKSVIIHKLSTFLIVMFLVLVIDFSTGKMFETLEPFSNLFFVKFTAIARVMSLS